MALSSLGGLSGLGTNGHIGINSPNGESGIHLTVDRQVSLGMTKNTEDVCYEGPWEDLVAALKSIGVGSIDVGGISSLPKGGADSESSSEFGQAAIVSARLTRVRGGVGRLAVGIRQTVHACTWSIDWTEVSKPIKTWHADKEGGAPDLTVVREFESLDEAGQAKAIVNKKIGSKTLEGDTLKLCKLISKGIEAYTRYAPVVTCTMTTDSVPRLGDFPIGKVGDPKCPFGWKDVMGRDAEDVVGQLTSPDTGQAYQWLRIRNVSTPNADGTFQWVMSWQAADDIETDLYETNA